jgi:hypothetical protein
VNVSTLKAEVIKRTEITILKAVHIQMMGGDSDEQGNQVSGNCGHK